MKHVDDVHPDNPCVRPEHYPVPCTASADDLRQMKRWTLDEDCIFPKTSDYKWPPRDDDGWLYEIHFSADELNDSFQLGDNHGCDYYPFAGNRVPYREPDQRYCNGPLRFWRDRYPNVRYCSQYVDYDHFDYCYHHKGRKDIMKTAEEYLQTGLFVKTIDHLYAKLDGWKRLVAWGGFESLMGESTYEFAEEYREQTFDFSGIDIQPDGVDENGQLTVKCGFPTQHTDPAFSLFNASMMAVQMLSVQPQIMYESIEDGEGMMESKSVEYASLTSPTEADPSQEFETLSTWTEHHLNLPFSRLVRDRPKLLERGGVDIDPASDQADEVSGDDIVLEIEASPENIDTDTHTDHATDPNQFDDETPISEKLAESTGADLDPDPTPDSDES